MKTIPYPRLYVAFLLPVVVVAGLDLRSWTVAAEKDPDVPMTRPQEMLAVHYTNFGHNSTFVELEGGRILHFGGSSFTTSDDGGITWSKPFTRKDIKGNPVGGGAEPSLVRLSGRGIGLAARVKDANKGDEFEWTRSNHMTFWRSEDGGETWQPPVRMTPQGVTTASYQDVFLRTSSGRIILPAFHFLGQRENGWRDVKPPANGVLVRGQWAPAGAHYFDSAFCAVYVVYSDDDGRTWKRNRDGELMVLHDWNESYSGVNESSLAEVAPGRLLIVMRNGMGRLFQAWSNNNGETWTRPQPMSLASSTAPAQIRKLATGHLLIVWNQEGEEEVLRGLHRNRLSCAISRNGGSVWEFFQNVESFLPGTRVEPGPIRAARPAEIHFEPGQPAPERNPQYVTSRNEFGRCSYPSVLVLKDRVLITHTYTQWEDDPVKGQLVQSSRKPGGFNQKLKVIPLKWFYGGKEPANNPFLKEAYEPAKP